MGALILTLLVAVDAAHDDTVARAEAAMRELNYDHAAELWELAVESAPDEDARTEAHMQAGIARRVIGEDTSARLHFIYVLQRQPWRKMTDDETPKVRQFFELVREEVRLQKKAAKKPDNDAPKKVSRPTTVTQPEPVREGIDSELFIAGIFPVVYGAAQLAFTAIVALQFGGDPADPEFSSRLDALLPVVVVGGVYGLLEVAAGGTMIYFSLPEEFRAP